MFRNVDLSNSLIIDNILLCIHIINILQDLEGQILTLKVLNF